MSLKLLNCQRSFQIRTVRCRVGVFRKITKCKAGRRTYSIIVISRRLNPRTCECYVKRKVRNCHCRCKKPVNRSRCNRRNGLFVRTFISYSKKNCRCIKKKVRVSKKIGESQDHSHFQLVGRLNRISVK